MCSSGKGKLSGDGLIKEASSSVDVAHLLVIKRE